MKLSSKISFAALLAASTLATFSEATLCDIDDATEKLACLTNFRAHYKDTDSIPAETLNEWGWNTDGTKADTLCVNNFEDFTDLVAARSEDCTQDFCSALDWETFYDSDDKGICCAESWIAIDSGVELPDGTQFAVVDVSNEKYCDTYSEEKGQGECCSICTDPENDYYAQKCVFDSSITLALCLTEDNPEGFGGWAGYPCDHSTDGEVFTLEGYEEVEECPYFEDGVEQDWTCNPEDGEWENPMEGSTGTCPMCDDFGDQILTGNDCSTMDELAESGVFLFDSLEDHEDYWGSLFESYTMMSNIALLGADFIIGEQVRCFMVNGVINSGHFAVVGGENTDVRVIDPQNNADAQPITVANGKFTVIGGSNEGRIVSSTTGSVSVAGLTNEAEVEFTNSLDLFVGDVLNSGDIAITDVTATLIDISTSGHVDITTSSISATGITNSGEIVVSVTTGDLNLLDNSGEMTFDTCQGYLTVGVNTGTLNIIDSTGLFTIGDNQGVINISGGDSVVDFIVAEMSNDASIILEEGVSGTLSLPNNVDQATQVTIPDSVAENLAIVVTEAVDGGSPAATTTIGLGVLTLGALLF